MVKRRIALSLIICFIMILTACGAKKMDSTGSAPQIVSTENKAIEAPMPAENGAAAKDKGVAFTSADGEKSNNDMKIIQNCELFIVVDDLKKFSADMHSKTEQYSGYIENEELTEYNSTAKVRIPSNKFEEFIKYAEGKYDVKNKHISTENITEAYVDNDARIKNLMAQEAQMLDILKKANTVEDVLKVQTELYRIRGDLESLQAKKKSWDKLVDYSTITLRVDKKQIVQESKLSIITGSEFFKAASKGFTNTGVALILFIENILIFIISNVIVLFALCLGAYFGYKKIKKYSKKKE